MLPVLIVLESGSNTPDVQLSQASQSFAFVILLFRSVEEAYPVRSCWYISQKKKVPGANLADNRTPPLLKASKVNRGKRLMEEGRAAQSVGP